jgi:hypothetical protein
MIGILTINCIVPQVLGGGIIAVETASDLADRFPGKKIILLHRGKTLLGMLRFQHYGHFHFARTHSMFMFLSLRLRPNQFWKSAEKCHFLLRKERSTVDP